MKLAIVLVTLAPISLNAAGTVKKAHPAERISIGAAAKAKIALRIIDDAADAKLVERDEGRGFDPFTEGMLQGLEKDLEEEQSESPRVGDRDLAFMLSVDLDWMEGYRVEGFLQPFRSEVMNWYLDCTHEIHVALRSGVVPYSYGACEYSKAKSDAIESGRVAALKAEQEAMRHPVTGVTPSTQK